MKNPFDISFGKKPAEVISRFRQTSEIMDTFTADTVTQQIYMITGVRGSGKTVLMNSIANDLELEKNWLVIRLNPNRDLLQGLSAKLAGNPLCAQLFRDARLNLSAFGFGVEIQGSSPVLDMEAAVENMMKILKRRQKRVLVTIDEVTNNKELQTFCSTFQILIGQELPVFLLMTGLYENIEELQNTKNLTFLYRAPKLRTEPLNIGMIASKYEHIFSVSHETAVHFANLTKGFPFAFQALGYSLWNHKGNEEESLPEYRQLLEEYVYEKIWSELSEKDRLIATGIAHSPSGRIKEINDYLGLKPDEINQYRKRLSRKGIVNCDRRGFLTFSLPFLGEFVIDHES